MDSDDELMASLLMEEEADIEAEEEENMTILACLLQKPKRPPMSHPNWEVQSLEGGRPSQGR